MTSIATPAPSPLPVRHCPWCGARFDEVASLVQEYFEGDDSWFACWCRTCGRPAEITARAEPVVTEQVLIPTEDAR